MHSKTPISSEKSPSNISPSGINPSRINYPSGINPPGIYPSGINPSGIYPSGINPSGIGLSGSCPLGPCPPGTYRSENHTTGNNHSESFLSESFSLGNNPSGIHPLKCHPTGCRPSISYPSERYSTVSGDGPSNTFSKENITNQINTKYSGRCKKEKELMRRTDPYTKNKLSAGRGLNKYMQRNYNQRITPMRTEHQEKGISIQNPPISLKLSTRTVPLSTQKLNPWKTE